MVWRRFDEIADQGIVSWFDNYTLSSYLDICMADTLDIQGYRQALSSLFIEAAQEVMSQPRSKDLQVDDRVARGLLDVADFVASDFGTDQLDVLAAFYPDPHRLSDVLAERPSSPREFRRTDPDERISDYLGQLMKDAVQGWVDWGSEHESVTAHPLVELLESSDTPLEWKLAAIGQLEDYLDFLEQFHVEEARDLGWSWARIAGPLGRSRQAVQQKFSWIDKRSTPWTIST